MNRITGFKPVTVKNIQPVSNNPVEIPKPAPEESANKKIMKTLVCAAGAAALAAAAFMIFKRPAAAQQSLPIQDIPANVADMCKIRKYDFFDEYALIDLIEEHSRKYKNATLLKLSQEQAKIELPHTKLDKDELLVIFEDENLNPSLKILIKAKEYTNSLIDSLSRVGDRITFND